MEARCCIVIECNNPDGTGWTLQTGLSWAERAAHLRKQEIGIAMCFGVQHTEKGRKGVRKVYRDRRRWGREAMDLGRNLRV